MSDAFSIIKAKICFKARTPFYFFIAILALKKRLKNFIFFKNIIEKTITYQ
jgi:hypothetical protein